MKNTVVLFDIGAVLLKISYKSFYSQASQYSRLSAEDFKDRYVRSGLEKNILMGKISTEQYLDEVKRIISPEVDLSHEKLKDIVGSSWKEPIKSMLTLRDGLFDSGYAVGLFSNISLLALETISARFPEIFDVYGPRVYSFEVGSIKPEPEMYRRITGYGKVVLIDDKEKYLKTGKDDFGWHCILYTEFIDKSEAIRQIHDSDSEGDFRTASSAEEVAKILKEIKV